MCKLFHLLWSFVILSITYVSSSTTQPAPTPYLIIMAKTLYQKGLHYIMIVDNYSSRDSYTVQVDSINPFTGEVRKGRKTDDWFIRYRIPFENYQEENIRLNMTIFGCSKTLGCTTQIAMESRVLPVIVDPSVNLIQISQSYYHRNETVRFRVISYVSNTVALLSGEFDKIYIEDSKMRRVKQWMNVPLLQALEGLNFTISPKADLGKWRINLVLGQIVDYEEFNVNEKQRPMFTVKLRQPKYLRLDAKYFYFEVCAEYPFVESMEASIQGNFCIEERRFVGFTEKGKPSKNCVSIDQGMSDFKECITFSKQKTDMLRLNKLLEKDYIMPYPLLKSVLSITVKQQNGYYVQESVIGEVGNQQMDLKVDSPSFYKPGLPFQGTVSVRSKDDRPVVGAIVLLTSKLVILNGTSYRTDEQGLCRFSFPSISADAGTIELSFEVVEHPDLSSNSRMLIPMVTKTLKPSISKIGEFLQLELDENSCPSITRTILFRIRSTVSFNKDTVRAAVISERNFTSYFTFINTPMPEKCEDTDNPTWGHYKCVKGQQIKCLDGWHGDNCLTPCPSNQSCASKSNRKSIERLTIYTRKGYLDVTETWHRSTQIVIWAKVTKNQITDIISDTVSFKKADVCSLPAESPKVRLNKTSVEHNSPLVMSISGVNSKEMRCSLSVARDCKIGCADNVNDIDSNEKLNKLVAEYITWCQSPIDRSFSERVLERDFDNAGFTLVTNFPIDRTSRVRRSATFRGKRSAPGIESVAKPSFPKEAITSQWNLQTFRGPRQELKFKAPSSPGKWRAQILCVSPRGIRMSSAAKFVVEKLIHLKASLPVSFQVGKKENIPISLVFSGKVRSEVTFKVTVSNNSELTFESHNKFRWEKPKHKILNIGITPRQIGTMVLVLNATAVPKDGNPFHDLIKRAITIEPRGATKTENFEHVSCKESFGVIPIPAPKVAVEEIVKGSQKVAVLLSGNVVGEKINNLNFLIRAPSGLGERNAGILSVNLNILEYYKATGYNNKKILRQLRNYIIAGYKKQLQYRRPDGSFAPSDKINTTSTWLTTFIFSTLYRSIAEVNINDSVLESALAFILSRQNKNGCFEERGDVILFSLAGGFFGRQRDTRRLTAFVLYSLQSVLERGGFKKKITSVLPAAFQCLKSKSQSLGRLDTHSLAVVAQALAKYSNSDPLAKRALVELRKKEKRKGDESFWLTENRDKLYWNERLTSDVETTSNAVLAKLWMKKSEALAGVVPALRWLVRRRNSFKWYTYIDQIEALKALTAAAIISDATGSFDPTMEVRGYDGDAEKFKIRKAFETDTRDLVAQSVHASSITKLTYQRLGKGCVLIAITRYYNKL